jgi:CSLREA domain-containing protein
MKNRKHEQENSINQFSRAQKRGLKLIVFITLIIFLGFIVAIVSKVASAKVEPSERTISSQPQLSRSNDEGFDAPSAVFTVNSTADTNDGACTTNAGGCTLREAIIAANNGAGADTIVFNIGTGSPTINVGGSGLGPLPTITGAVSIIGESGNARRVELNGANAGTGAHGLYITAGNNVIRALVINRFSGQGVRLETGGGNSILDCIIGLNAAGNAALGNGAGIVVFNSPNNVIGDNLRNTISGNNADGILIDGAGSTNNTVRYNFIGTDINGNAAIGNGINGVVIRNASNNTIGLSIALPPLGNPANVIAGNSAHGVAITGSTATGNVVWGNIIGLNVTANIDLGNGQHGVYILNGANNNAIGKRTDDGNYYGNFISGNGVDGIRIDGNGTSGNVIAKNVIGLGASDVAFGNSNDGVFISNGASNNFVGDDFWAEGNVISGNSIDGVRIDGSATTGNKVGSNIIGLNSNKSEPRANGFNGVVISNAPNNTIARVSTFANIGENVIGGNGRNGIGITGSAATGNLIQNNCIGGAGNLKNLQHGIYIINAASNNTIGGVSDQEQNTITGNGGDGISIESGVSNFLKFNSINNNGGLGVDLGFDGVTANDAGDSDTGANNLQNFPVLTSAFSNATRTLVAGTFNSAPNTTFTIRFYANDACDSSGYGEAMTPIFSGNNQVTTDAGGNASFNFSLVGSVSVGKFITAIAADPNGNSSELSQCRQVLPEPAGALQFSAASYSVNENGGSVTITITRAGGSNGSVSVSYATSNGTATAGQDYNSASGTLSWSSGDANPRTFTVPILEDTLDESNETINLALSGPTGGATLGSPSVSVLTINDNDTAGTVQFSEATYSANEGINLIITVTRAGGTASGVSVNYATSNGTAIAGQDYTAASGTLTFGANETKSKHRTLIHLQS